MSRSRFCPKCGKPITTGRLCSDCTVTRIEYEPPRVQISEYGRVWEQGRWIHFSDINTLLVRRVKEALGHNVDIALDPFEFTPESKNKITVTARATVDGHELELPVILSYRQCDFGQKRRTGYYEGILQIQNPHDEVLPFVEKELAKVDSKGVFVTQIKETKNGIDLYVSNKNYLRVIGPRLVDQFGGELVLNPQLFTHDHQSSKDVYRLNAVVRLPHFHRGDVISYRPNRARTKNSGIHVVRVTSMGKIIKGMDLASGNLVAFELRYTQDLEILDVMETTVSSTHPELSVLDPETYQEITLLNEDIAGDFTVGEKVSIVQTQYGALLVNPKGLNTGQG